MPRGTRDFQVKRVYTAERCVHDKGRSFDSVREMQTYTDRVTSSAWFQREFRPLTITVTDGRGRRKACAAHSSRVGYMVKMPRWSRREAILLHEIAHVVAWGDWHGEKFARAFLLLVKHFMGLEAFQALLTAFREHRVHWQGSVA